LGDSEYDVKKEACWAITNATSGGSKNQIAFLVSKGCIKPLCALLNSADPRLLSIALDALENVLKSDDRDSKNNTTYADMVEESEGLEKIEALQTHQNIDIYNKAVHILETYFGAEEESENLQPNVSSGTNGQQTFSFGTNWASQVPQGGFKFTF